MASRETSRFDLTELRYLLTAPVSGMRATWGKAASRRGIGQGRGTSGNTYFLALITHTGQEFNLVLEGTVVVVIGEKEFTLTAGDSIYFNPTIPHGQRCGGDVKARFVTVIAE